MQTTSRFRLLILAGLASTWLAGCTVHARAPALEIRPARPAGRVVVIAKSHRHTTHCGHYRYQQRWYYVAGHSHGRSCGHVVSKGVWVLKR